MAVTFEDVFDGIVTEMPTLTASPALAEWFCTGAQTMWWEAAFVNRVLLSQPEEIQTFSK